MEHFLIEERDMMMGQSDDKTLICDRAQYNILYA